MNWTSIGSYKLPSGARDGWSSSHAQLPTVLCLDDSSVRVFFATRSVKQVSSIGFVDLFFDGCDSFKVVSVSKSPVLKAGNPVVLMSTVFFLLVSFLLEENIIYTTWVGTEGLNRLFFMHQLDWQ